MHERTRTNDLRFKLSQIVDKKLILIDSKRALDTLVGIKISLIQFQDSRISHQNAVESILSKLSSKKFRVQESDRLRFKHIILPKIDPALLSWDSASSEVSFWDAVELFEVDLTYLSSKELSVHLPQACAAARNELLSEIGSARLHSKFGRGSKVSHSQYQRLVRATAGGWMRHLSALGVAATEPVFELGEPYRHAGASLESDFMPWQQPD